MEIRKLSSKFYVTGQVSPEDLALLAEQGFRNIVNNRPDNEAHGQPRSDELAAEAARLGLNYLYLPVESGRLTEKNVDDFSRACGDLDGPVLLFCRSGARSTALWRVSEAARRDGEH